MTKNEKILKRALEMAVDKMHIGCRYCPCIDSVCGNNHQCNANLIEYFIRKVSNETKGEKL